MSPKAAGGVYETLIVPLQASIEGRRDALTWDYVIEGGKARILGIGGVASGAVTIPESVTRLGELAFGYSSLTTVRTVKGDAYRVKSLLKSAGLNVSVTYDESLPKGVDPVKPTPELEPDGPEMAEVTEPYAAPKAVKLYGCVFNGGAPETIKGIAIEQSLLPEGEPTDMQGKRWNLAKAASIAEGVGLLRGRQGQWHCHRQG